MNDDGISEDERRLARIWNAVALRGATAVGFGVALLAWPHIRLSELAALVGAFALADGLAALAGAFSAPIADRERVWLAPAALVSVATGVIVLVEDLSARELLFAIGGWVVAEGVLEFVGALALPFANIRSLLLTVDGVLNAFFGMTMLVKPGGGALALLSLVAAYALVSGTVRLAFARELRRVLPEEDRRAWPWPTARSPARG